MKRLYAEGAASGDRIAMAKNLSCIMNYAIKHFATKPRADIRLFPRGAEYTNMANVYTHWGNMISSAHEDLLFKLTAVVNDLDVVNTPLTRATLGGTLWARRSTRRPRMSMGCPRGTRG